jgi:parvulin-like peptidyl-prolyl isomerase
VSKPIESNGVYYVFQVLARSEVDEELYAQRAPVINDQLHQEKVQTYVTYWYGQLRENAEIEDMRRGF